MCVDYIQNNQGMLIHRLLDMIHSFLSAFFYPTDSPMLENREVRRRRSRGGMFQKYCRIYNWTIFQNFKIWFS